MDTTSSGFSEATSSFKKVSRELVSGKALNFAIKMTRALELESHSQQKTSVQKSEIILWAPPPRTYLRLSSISTRLRLRSCRSSVTSES